MLGQQRTVLADCGKTQCVLKPYCDLTNGAGARMARRMLKMAVQHGRSERRGSTYSVSYVEPLRDARTKLADFFSILLEVLGMTTTTRIAWQATCQARQMPRVQ